MQLFLNLIFQGNCRFYILNNCNNRFKIIILKIVYIHNNIFLLIYLTKIPVSMVGGNEDTATIKAAK